MYVDLPAPTRSYLPNQARPSHGKGTCCSARTQQTASVHPGIICRQNEKEEFRAQLATIHLCEAYQLLGESGCNVFLNLHVARKIVMATAICNLQHTNY
jgi:hypothetical protein